MKIDQRWIRVDSLIRLEESPVTEPTLHKRYNPQSQNLQRAKLGWTQKSPHPRRLRSNHL